jgi:ATP-dependent Clp protease ATP-binding subunit ClpA
VHHGVKISDSALVEAANLSDRYITERFLPDKAIDLVDEAAAKLKMEITSKPAQLDEVDRRVLQLEMERLSLAKAAPTDRGAAARLGDIERQLAGDGARGRGERRTRWGTGSMPGGGRGWKARHGEGGHTRWAEWQAEP